MQSRFRTLRVEVRANIDDVDLDVGLLHEARTQSTDRLDERRRVHTLVCDRVQRCCVLEKRRQKLRSEVALDLRRRHLQTLDCGVAHTAGARPLLPLVDVESAEDAHKIGWRVFFDCIVEP